MTQTVPPDAGIPLAYLEAYPFPAFVLHHSAGSSSRSRLGNEDDLRAVRKDTFAAGDAEGSPPDADGLACRVVWSNGAWSSHTSGSSLRRCVGPSQYGSFQQWATAPASTRTFVLAADSLPIPLRLVKTDLAPQSGDGTYCLITSVDDVLPDIATPPDTRAPASPTRTPGQSSSPMAFDEADTDPATRSTTPAHQADPEPPRSPAAAPGLSPATDCRSLLRNVDWAKTPLGPREQWRPELHTMVDLIMASPTQDALWVGPDMTMIYNQRYCDIIEHPKVFGKSAKLSWGPVWEDVEHLIARCMQHGESCYRPNDLLLYEKGPRGHFVEKYHTWSFQPIKARDGIIIGIYNPTIETTASVLARRRQDTLRDISEQTLTLRTQRDLFDTVAAVMEGNPKDVPFIMCYSIAVGAQALLTLESSVGVPAGHPAAPSTMTISFPARPLVSSGLKRSDSPTSAAPSSASALHRATISTDKQAWPVMQAIATRQCVVVDDCRELIDGFPLRQWDALPESAIVVPLCQDGSDESVPSVIIIGLNVQRPLDTDYEEWINVLRAHLTSSLTSVRAMEAEKERLMEQERMERAKQAWFQGAAHDLRSPLTLVAGPLDDALSTSLTKHQRHLLVLAQRNVTRIQRLVNSLLDFSRLEAGKLAGRFLPADLGRFVGDLAALFRPAVESRHIRYEVDIKAHEDVVFFDPTLLETVVTNLLSNALKYTEDGEIKVAVSYDRTHASIAVSDTGFGIPAAELGAVTDRYHRATTALSRGTEGTGIGLALAKEIVRLHDGELIVESSTADENPTGLHGSTFTARLPLMERQVVVDNISREVFGTYGKAVAEEAMDNEIDVTIGELPHRGEGLLFEPEDVLLVVDDNDDMRAYISGIFAPFCTVRDAPSAEKALQMATADPPDLILTDLMMRGMNGLDLVAAVRQQQSTRLVPIILHSAATDDELKLQALTMGAEDFLVKPFKPRELLARVQLHMQLGKRRIDLEARFAQREQEIALLSDYCPSGIIRADSQGRIVYGNAAWRDFAGMDEEADPNMWPSLVDDETRIRLTSQWDEIVSGDIDQLHVKWRWRSGTTVQATFLRLDRIRPGVLTGLLGCLSDISYQEEQLSEAERRRLEAEESKRQQELLIDFTSHEIRTPVSAILQCSSVVKDNLLSLAQDLREAGSAGFRPSGSTFSELEADVEALESIHQCGLVQERIANDILSLAKIQLDMLTFYDVDLDVHREAQRVVSVFKSEALAKNIELSLVMGDSLAACGVVAVKTDHVRVGQVVTNLVSNAMRFTAGSATRRITITYDVAYVPPADDSCAVPADVHIPATLPPAEGTPMWLYISVRDTGPGLGPEELEVLFQRFSQGNKMIHSRYGGSGLGLFICKKITDLLQGRIEVQSRVGEGSVFRFFVAVRAPSPRFASPAAQVATPLPQIGATASQGALLLDAAQGPAPSPAGDNHAYHLLVVEDNDINRTVLKRQIEKAGWTCDVAVDGQQALQRISDVHDKRQQVPSGRNGYDAILMDLEMPVMDGLTAIRHIREAEAAGSHERQLVIALTGNARQQQVDTALEAGMDDVMIKPYKLPTLLATIHTAIASRSSL